MKKLSALPIAPTLTVSCVPFAQAENAAESARRVLMVYCSAAGTTRGVAEKPAEAWPDGKRFTSRTTVEEFLNRTKPLGIEP